jgi:hypothetical protein
MKRILIAIMLLGLTGTGVSRAADTSSSDALVWCGLDYSMVKMIGTADFKQPSQIFPGMLEQWNALFMKEMIPLLEKMASPVQSDLAAVTARNEKASEKQIERKDGTKDEMVTPTHITDADLASIVKSLKMTHDSGTGLIFVMDRLVKAQDTGCLYVVFFDVSSRKVLHSERVVTAAGGAGFRNFWFKPIKTAVAGLPKQYKAIKATK